ncbi:MAG: hypothetical protein ACOCW1_05225, partial [Chitinispirillaceae bacterium]
MKTNEVDFARAFFGQDSAHKETASGTKVPSVPSLRYPPYSVRKRPVRIMLKKNTKQAVIYSSSEAEIRSAG